MHKGKGPLRSHGKSKKSTYEVRGKDRSDAPEMHHLVLLKQWKEAVPVALTMMVPEREDLGLLGLEVSPKNVAQFTLKLIPAQ